MNDATWITILIAVLGVVMTLIGAIYASLSKGVAKNDAEIGNIKDKYQTKEDANRREDKSIETINRIEEKIDRLINNMSGGDR